MLVYFLKKVVRFVDSPLIREFHYDMFHGAVVGGRPVPVQRYHCAPGLQPLRLALNVWGLSHVICPGVNLVVSQRVRDALSGFPNMAFLPARIEKVVECEFHLGDFSWYESPACDRPRDFLLSVLPDVQAQYPNVGPYFELLPARLADLQSQFDRGVALGIPTLVQDDPDMATLELSAEMVMSYPYIFSPEADVLSEQVFDRLSPYLSRIFFNVASVEIGSAGA